MESHGEGCSPHDGLVLAVIAAGCFAIAILWVSGIVTNGDWGTFVGGVLTGSLFSILAWLSLLQTRVSKFRRPSERHLRRAGR